MFSWFYSFAASKGKPKYCARCFGCDSTCSRVRLLSTFDKWIEQAFQRAASFSFQQFQYIGVGIILANIVGVPILIPLMYAGEHALGVAILVVLDVLPYGAQSLSLELENEEKE